jgi:hypothetical protein
MTFNCLLVLVTISVANRTCEFQTNEAPAVCHSELGFADVPVFNACYHYREGSLKYYPEYNLLGWHTATSAPACK